MQTLAPGACKRLASQTVRGFTLFELLVVIVVLSVAAGLIVVRGTPGDGTYLQADAQKLSQLLRIAQQESILKSKDIRFVADSQGYAFQEFTGSRWVPVSTEPMLRPRAWDNGPFKVSLVYEGAANQYLTLQSTPGLARQAVVLERNQTQVVLQSQASGLFVVSKPQQRPQAGGMS
ncbi:prepilin-type N-terminal cleavage/methylation domain-containing protein [Limnobacter sp.]|uniref:prepilin-type N-terminal cleavage/methylation domain-containing protein n=1 Tax=Limnobacter sp. TaxID=2003368 RepID=UPI003514E638